MTNEIYPPSIRVSVGTAIVLGLREGSLDAEPQTAYLMTYRMGKCIANCGFCPQAKGSLGSADLLSRVTWPVFSTKTVLKRIENETRNSRVKRVCIQALNYPGVFAHLESLIKALRQHSSPPISVSCQPMNSKNIKKMAQAGAERIGIALDAATKKLFSEIKGSTLNSPYDWEKHFELLTEAVGFFGKGNVSTHLIVGLGETEREIVRIIKKLADMKILPALFAFTPIRGTRLESRPKPLLEIYRRIQVARFLIAKGLSAYRDMVFDISGHITNFGVEKGELRQIVESGKPFLTTGCPDCNRPFYNEKPSGPIYNYPRIITQVDLEEIKSQLGILAK